MQESKVPLSPRCDESCVRTHTLDTAVAAIISFPLLSGPVYTSRYMWAHSLALVTQEEGQRKGKGPSQPIVSVILFEVGFGN